jgi:hypothetical protein
VADPVLTRQVKGVNAGDTVKQPIVAQRLQAMAGPVGIEP